MLFWMKGDIFTTPWAFMVETQAIGRGTMQDLKGANRRP
jgi:hypothetical protein